MRGDRPHPISVLHIITRLIVGGAQENTLYTARYLDQNRYQVDVLSGKQTGSEGSLIEEGLSQHVPITFIPEMVRQVNPVLDAIALWKIFQTIYRKKYVIVHTHSSKAGILGRVAAKIAGAPVIVHTVHGWSFHDQMHPIKRVLYILLERFCARFTDALIVVTELDRQKGLQAKIGKPGQYSLIRSAILLEEFDPNKADRYSIRRGLGLPPEAPVLGTVGRFSAQKNPLGWIQVAKWVSQVVPECWFLMVGDGPLRPQAETMLNELGLKERTILPGIRRDVPELMAAMDVFLLTSRWEGLPRVIPQAMSMGLPVVATSVDGSKELIRTGVNGFLCPSGNLNCLSESCIELLNNAVLRQKISLAGRETVKQEFDLSQMIAQIDTLYRDLFNKF
jgi:glycosyltransferase involved in cell wall biosynthesis